MPKLLKYSTLYTVGGIGYGGMELAFRGHTHWSMLLAGGACFCALFKISEMPNKSLWKKCLMGTAVITTIEFISGVIVNIWLRWNVWSYADHPMNILGQVCPLFSCIWFLLCIPAMKLCGLMKSLLGRVRLLPREQ